MPRGYKSTDNILKSEVIGNPDQMIHLAIAFIVSRTSVAIRHFTTDAGSVGECLVATNPPDNILKSEVIGNPDQMIHSAIAFIVSRTSVAIRHFTTDAGSVGENQ